MKRKLMLGAALVAVLATAGGTYAWASAGATSTQTINACINGDGFLRLVGVNGNCRRGETPISWNTVGPAGQTGPTGAQGVAGRDGRDGQTGPQGPAGVSSVNPPDPDYVAATVMVTGQKTGAVLQHPDRRERDLARDRLATRSGVGPADREAAAQADHDHDRVGREDTAVPERAHREREPHVGADRPAEERPAGGDDPPHEREHLGLRRAGRQRPDLVHVPEDRVDVDDGGITAEDDWETPSS